MLIFVEYLTKQLDEQLLLKQWTPVGSESPSHDNTQVPVAKYSRSLASEDLELPCETRITNAPTARSTTR